jgi:hypothetical protein
MLARLLVLVGLLSLVSAAPKYVPEGSPDQLTTVMKAEEVLDFTRIRALAHSDAGEPWHHTADLFFAVHAGKSEYVVVDAVKDTKGWDFSSYEDLKSRAIYETKTSYKLLPQVVSLDQHDAKSVNDISSVHLEHCSSDRKLREGDLVIGSSHGAWYKSASVQPKLSTAGLLKTHAEADKHAIVLARRVLSVKTIADGGCVSATTESLHPLELFETMDIESSGYRPFHDVSVPLAVSTEERERELQNVANPDAPIVACPDFTFTKGKQFTQGTASGVSYNLGSQGGCLQYNYNIGSISMNYDWNSRAASQTNVVLSSGLVCSDCFLYTGAGFLVIAQYSTGSFFRAEIKVAGGAGFNLNVVAANPTIQGSKTIPILSQGSWQSISLGPSLAFNYAMGGVQADVSGSGTAVGQGKAIAGAQAQASAGFAYTGGKSWTPVSAFSSYKAPSVSMKFTSVRATSAVVMLTGRLVGKIVLGGAVGSVTGHVDITATVNIDYKTSSATTFSAVVADASRSLLSGSRDARTHAVGESVPIDSSYSGLVPNEEHFLFFSLITPDGQEIPIHEDRFTSTPEGKGSHRSQWKVPSDSRMQSASGYRIRVRCSNLYSRHVDTQPFGLNVFDPEHDPLVQSPRGGDVFQAGSRMPVKWDPSALHYFKKDGPMRGKHFKTRKVTFELHGEKDGGVKGSTRRGLNVGDRHDWENTGNAEIQIPEDFSRRFDRFYVQVHDAEADEVGGWNTGFFYVHHQKQQQAQKQLRAPASRRRSVKPRPPQDKQLQVVHNENRALATCASNFFFGFGVVASGGADSFSILLFDVPIGLQTQPVNLLPVKVICV